MFHCVTLLCKIIFLIQQKFFSQNPFTDLNNFLYFPNGCLGYKRHPHSKGSRTKLRLRYCFDIVMSFGCFDGWMDGWLARCTLLMLASHT